MSFMDSLQVGTHSTLPRTVATFLRTKGDRSAADAAGSGFAAQADAEASSGRGRTGRTVAAR